MNVTKLQVGFRLQYMEFLNWGTFHDKIWRIEPDGNNSLLTGAVGSGKSTVVDALTCLIVPHHKITFNKAAGAESKERNLTSYVKGNYSSKSDEIVAGGKAVTLRYKDAADATFTVIIADFYNTGYDTHVSLAQVFWIENDRVQKLLLISSKPLVIKECFTKIGDVRELKRRLRGDAFIEVFDDNFAQYSQRFRQLFGMNSDKAIDLFYQTVSMKSVSSLTTFVREQMLERTDIKSQIEDLKKRFDNLNKAYSTVQEIRRQRDVLTPLVLLDTTFGDFEKRILHIDGMIQSIPCYFAEKKLELLEVEIDNCERKLVQMESQLQGVNKILNARRDAYHELTQDICNNGGTRLEQIANEIKQKEEERIRKSDKYDEYQVLVSTCELLTVNTEQTFFRNIKTIGPKMADFRKRQDAIMAENGRISGERGGVVDKIKVESHELESLKSRINQIPSEILSIRLQLATELGIKEEEIPFVGELLKVNEREKEWEGALERLLHGFGVSMLVPEKYYSQISGYVNTRRLMDSRNKGIRFEYFRVPDGFKPDKYAGETDADSVFGKIDIKPGTSFELWLEAELQKRFNLRCVPVEEFQKSGDVITREGQIKTGRLRHVKDDRRELWDRRNFVLGWTNKEKIMAIEKYLNQLREKQKGLDADLLKLSTENVDINQMLGKLNQLVGYNNWNELNWQEEVKKLLNWNKNGRS